MVRATKASKGSSYGKDKSPSKSKNGSLNHDKISAEVNEQQNKVFEDGDVREQVNNTENHEQNSDVL